MKIGILTYHRSHNYGAVLQSYALKTYLSKLGYDVEIIDYWPDYRRGMYDLYDFSFFREKIGLYRKIKKFGRIVLIFPFKYVRFHRFQNFISFFLKVSPNNHPINKGKDISSNYDIIIYGSDQIWRFNTFKTFKGYDAVYWGKYPKDRSVKKITYAASMGVMEIDAKKKEFIKKHVNNFNCISIREKELKRIIRPFYNKSIFHVLDPVFLLSQREWEEIGANSTSLLKKKYILFYHLGPSAKAYEIARRLARKQNLKIIGITGGIKPFRDPFVFKQTIGPLEFISLVSNAAFVVSTSFHGVAFSLIFKKQFVAAGMNKNATRVIDLLTELDIPDHYLSDPSEIESLNEIDYNKVTPILKRKVKQSINYLKDSLDAKL